MLSKNSGDGKNGVEIDAFKKASIFCECETSQKSSLPTPVSKTKKDIIRYETFPAMCYIKVLKLYSATYMKTSEKYKTDIRIL